MRHLLFAIALAIAIPVNAQVCTLVIGYSQTSQWYNAGFEDYAPGGDAVWQLMTRGGAGIEKWADPNNSVWNSEVTNNCAQSSGAPDQVLMSISSDTLGTDVNAYIDAIEGAVITIRNKYPSVQRIILQSVVGGYGEGSSPCACGSGVVRASEQFPYINEAIDIVAAAHGSDVIRGIAPEVNLCAEYNDCTGHMTGTGNTNAAQLIGMYYQTFLGGGTDTVTNLEFNHTVPSETTLDALTVPPDVSVLITDVLISNPNANADCCASILGDDEVRAGPISVSAEDTVTMSFITGIDFTAGTVIRLRNAGNAGPLHFTVRGSRFRHQ